MEKETQIDTGVQDVFRRVFNNEELIVNRNTTAGDVVGWDSLSNIQMIIEIEKKFKLTFTTNEIVQLKNVGDLMDLLNVKLPR